MMIELDELEDQYSQKSKATYHGRIERISKKDFRKRIRRVESIFQTLLKQFAQSLANAFPSFYLVLVVYMIVKFFIFENTGRESEIISTEI